MDQGRQKSKAQEDLVNLYLRLNGYFVSKFIVHSPIRGKNKTEMDAVAIRHRFSREPERVIGPDPYLITSAEWTDIVLCEVKSKGQKIRYNEALVADPGAIATVLRWCGAFEEEEVARVSDELARILSANTSIADGPPTVEGPRTTRVRALLFSPERDSKRHNQPWFITGPQLMEYVGACLAPTVTRPSCSTNYDFQAWGEHEPIVRYFKGLNGNPPGDIRTLYRHLELD